MFSALYHLIVLGAASVFLWAVHPALALFWWSACLCYACRPRRPSRPPAVTSR